jgi:hypothetical protein
VVGDRLEGEIRAASVGEALRKRRQGRALYIVLGILWGGRAAVVYREMEGG